MKNYLWTCFVLLLTLVGQAQEASDTLLIGYTQAPPFIIEEEGSREGINIWLWEKVAEDLGLKYKLQRMGFAEMLEALKQGEIDVSINPLTITSERSKKMDFTHTYFSSNSTIVVYNSSSLQKGYQFLRAFFNVNFLRAFFALLLIIILFGIAIWIFEKRVNPSHFRSGWRGIWDGIWWSVVTMTTVGYGDKTPKSRAGKMIALIWMFSGLLFISGLTASVASMLTINQLQSNPEGFNEFKEAEVGCIKNSSTNEFLHERFFKNINTYGNVSDGLSDLIDGELDAFLYDEPILRYRIKKDPEFERLRLLPIKFDLQFYAFGLPKKNVELKNAISQKILEITESIEWRMILNEYSLSEI